MADDPGMMSSTNPAHVKPRITFQPNTNMERYIGQKAQQALEALTTEESLEDRYARRACISYS
jgi:hypothetical protein